MPGRAHCIPSSTHHRGRPVDAASMALPLGAAKVTSVVIPALRYSVQHLLITTTALKIGKALSRGSFESGQVSYTTNSLRVVTAPQPQGFLLGCRDASCNVPYSRDTGTGTPAVCVLSTIIGTASEIVRAPSQPPEVSAIILASWVCDRLALAAVWPTRAPSRILLRPP